MANVAALKKRAADFELKKQLDKAVATYQEILAAYDAGEDESPDVGLYNRVGDLLVRMGNTPEAVTLYERAVDLYAEGGFFNNAIALCNKILRTSPGRAVVYYKLGKISAAKGFKGDAKQNFLEYADRMRNAGDVSESFRALKEFAELCPDQDDIRLMLAEQLNKADRKGEAVEQLQRLHARYVSAGRTAEADATVARMRTIDPMAEVTGEATTRTAKRDDLVFLDLDAPAAPRTPAVPAPVFVPVQGIEPTVPVEAVDAGQVPAESPAMLGLEPTTIESADPMAGLEVISLDPSVEPSAARVTDDALGAATPDTAKPDDAAPVDAEPLVLLEFEEPAPTPEIPLLDVDAPTPGVSLDFIDLGEALLEPDGIPLVEPVRRSSVILADSAALLQASLELNPDDHGLRREYAEALLDRGDREAGLAELETALTGFERSGDLATARSVVNELLRLLPDSVRHHQKRVELTFRANDKTNLIEAYLALADALTRDGQATKAQVVYQRVIEIAPDDARAAVALAAFGPPSVEEAAPEVPVRATRMTPAPVHTPTRGTPRGRRYTVDDEPAPPAPDAEPAAIPPAPPAKGSDDDYVSLGDWLREDEGPKSTRMVVGEEEPSGDEQADFADMLRKFKQGVADNVEETDSESHYDLGVAFKEMGLLDEAIAEFQKALRGTTQRVRTFEALGQCFVDKGQLAVARTLLQRALNEPGTADEQLVGVLYLIGSVCETLGARADAKGFFERVFAVDIQFRDVGDRLNALDQARS